VAAGAVAGSIMLGLVCAEVGGAGGGSGGDLVERQQYGGMLGGLLGLAVGLIAGGVLVVRAQRSGVGARHRIWPIVLGLLVGELTSLCLFYFVGPRLLTWNLDSGQSSFSTALFKSLTIVLPLGGGLVGFLLSRRETPDDSANDS